jgi:hypothetical protein
MVHGRLHPEDLKWEDDSATLVYPTRNGAQSVLEARPDRFSGIHASQVKR